MVLWDVVWLLGAGLSCFEARLMPRTNVTSTQMIECLIVSA
jgi:hypothetical protein